MTEEEEKEKIKAEFIKIMSMLRKWPEDKVKTIIKERLENEGWTIIRISMGREQGKDLEAIKESKVIHIEAKGEPKSARSYQQERRSNIGGALMSLIAHMKKDDDNNVFCMAFPDNGYYLRGVSTRIPLYVRNKLKIFAIFLGDDNTIQVLFPHSNDATSLDSFDALFKAK